MRSYLIRHEADLESSTSFSDGCGYLMYMAWGGKAALRWSESKLKELELLSAIEVELGLDYLKNHLTSKDSGS